MTAVNAIYDGQVFIPEKLCDIKSGTKVTLTIETKNSFFSEKKIKLSMFRNLTTELAEINKSDPLPPEFDTILSQRLHFREN